MNWAVNTHFTVYRYCRLKVPTMTKTVEQSWFNDIKQLPMSAFNAVADWRFIIALIRQMKNGYT